MHSTLTAKPGDDPHDVLVVAPDAVRVAPSDEEELSSLLHQAARHRSQTRAESDTAVGRVPPVDTTFRPVNDVRVPGGRRSTAARALRGFMALLLAACIGVAAVGWKAYGEVAKRQIAKWTTQFALTSEQAAPPAPLAAPADTADAAPPPPAQSAAEAVAPAAAPSASADPAPSLQSMARDLASVTQQVEQLKASIDELKAGQQQMSRDLAKASDAKASEVKASEVKPSETNPRPRIPAAPPRAVVARARKPAPYYPPPQALVPPMPPQVAAPYVPRQTEPQPQFAAEPPQPDPELTSVPRPPMPLR
jgi:hypothetical protein